MRTRHKAGRLTGIGSSQKVLVGPLPFRFCIPGRALMWNRSLESNFTANWAVWRLIWVLLQRQLLCMRDAVLTVSPNKQYRGLAVPTTEATTGPECMPTFKATYLQWVEVQGLCVCPSTTIRQRDLAHICSTWDDH